MRTGRSIFPMIAGCLLLIGSLATADEAVAPPDSVNVESDSTIVSADSAATDIRTDSTAAISEKPGFLPPQARMLDTLVHYFSKCKYRFNVQDQDLYPRNAAGFLSRETSYFTITYFETPLRTIVTPFGLSAGQINIRSGESSVRPLDRVVPPDGRIDFNDIATGDVNSVSLVEGPLSAYSSVNGGLAMLYLRPFPIPDDVPKSEFTVERGAYGYAYTRARIGRMFGNRTGFTFSTDYRKGDGLNTSGDDDAYYVRTHFMNKLMRGWIIDLYANIYRRKGGYPVLPGESGYNFRRLRRDRQFVASLASRNFFGGQFTGKFDYQSSRAAYSSSSSSIWRTLKPEYGQLELAYLRRYDRAVYQLSLVVGKEKYDIDQFYYSRDFGYVMLSGLTERMGGQLFFFGRLKKAEQEEMSVEGTAGLAKSLIGDFRTILSGGFLTRWPTMTDRFSPSRSGTIGATALLANYVEHGSPELEAERKLTGNAAILLDDGKWNLSLSLNAGILDNAIYYDRVYNGQYSLEVYPDNDNIRFADLSLAAGVDTLGPFFVNLSATGRSLDSDRYGKRPPYSPRWQLFGQGGIRYYLAKYKLHIRLFGAVTYTEKPLSYQLKELETTAVITGGYNLQLKDFTFYYMIHNFLDEPHYQPEGYGYTGWFYSWGFNWKFID